MNIYAKIDGALKVWRAGDAEDIQACREVVGQIINIGNIKATVLAVVPVGYRVS